MSEPEKDSTEPVNFLDSPATAARKRGFRIITWIEFFVILAIAIPFVYLLGYLSEGRWDSDYNAGIGLMVGWAIRPYFVNRFLKIPDSTDDPADE